MAEIPRANRARVVRRTVAWPLILAACGATPASPRGLATDGRWHEQFVDACRFVPPGFDSLMLAEELGYPVSHSWASEADARWFPVVRVGRRFEPPANVGIGMFDGVEIWSFPPRVMADYFPVPSAPALFDVDGVPVWAEAAEHEGGRGQGVRAQVAGRFHLWASSADLMRQALRREGDLEALLARFPATTVVPVDAVDLVCAIASADAPSPRPGQRYGKLRVAADLVAYRLRDPARFVIVSVGPIPEECLQALGHDRAAVPVEVDGIWHKSVLRLEGKRPTERLLRSAA
jgi:hypothetical protein